MSCKGRAGEVPVCEAGKCQCAKKSGGDSKEDTARVMKTRLSECVINLPIEDKEVVHRGVHFGQAVLYVTKHFAVCKESAITHLMDLHHGKHVEIHPSFENPLYVVFETIPVE